MQIERNQSATLFYYPELPSGPKTVPGAHLHLESIDRALEEFDKLDQAQRATARIGLDTREDIVGEELAAMHRKWKATHGG